MKKSVIALILIAALIIIVSPGLIGKLAEESVGDNLNWAAQESGELVVTSEGFNRGWFSSEGQHRIEFGDGNMRSVLTTVPGMGGDEELPVLLINTHIDHGLIPVSSMGREEGSLAPGLGSAISTLAIEYGADQTVDIPGTVYSNIGLGGDLDSSYVLEAGALEVDDGEVTWESTTINIGAGAKTGGVSFDGDLGAMTFGNTLQTVSIDGVTFAGQQKNTPYGFMVGDVDMNMGAMTINAGGVQVGGMKGMKVNATSSVDDGVAKAAMRMELNGQNVPGFGEISIIADMDFNSIDAAALGAVTKQLEDMMGVQDPTQVMLAAEEDLKDLVASGLDIGVDQFEIALPMGTVEMKMTLTVPESDRSTFEWTSLLLSGVAEVDIIVPEALVQLATSMNPQAGAIVGMGYLKKEGDVYILDADFKKGLLTVNGAPIPLPMGAFQ